MVNLWASRLPLGLRQHTNCGGGRGGGGGNLDPWGAIKNGTKMAPDICTSRGTYFGKASNSQNISEMFPCPNMGQNLEELKPIDGLVLELKKHDEKLRNPKFPEGLIKSNDHLSENQAVQDPPVQKVDCSALSSKVCELKETSQHALL